MISIRHITIQLGVQMFGVIEGVWVMGITYDITKTGQRGMHDTSSSCDSHASASDMVEWRQQLSNKSRVQRKTKNSNLNRKQANAQNDEGKSNLV